MATNPNPNRRPSGTPAGGQFAPSAHPESGLALDGEAQRPRSGLEAALRAEEGDAWPLTPEAPWSWSALSEEVGKEAAERLYVRSGGSLGKAIALAVEADNLRLGDPGGPDAPDPGPEPHEGSAPAQALADERFVLALAEERRCPVGDVGRDWTPATNAEGLRQVSPLLPPGLALPRGCEGCATGDHDACESPDDAYADEDPRGRETRVVTCCCGEIS